MMKIFGVSQSSGAEKVLKIERGLDGIVLTLADHVGGKEPGRIKVTSDALVGAIMEPVPGGSIIEGALDQAGQPMQLVVEVRRNCCSRFEAKVALERISRWGLDDLGGAGRGMDWRLRLLFKCTTDQVNVM